MALHAAVDAGVNFIDTADVYGDGRSERLIARLRRERPGETIYVATKAGRKLPQRRPAATHGRISRLDRREPQKSGGGHARSAPAAQPHPAVCDTSAVFGGSTRWSPPASSATTASASGRATGVEGDSASARPSVQIIFNLFRMKPR
jgi:hypothetical protein